MQPQYKDYAWVVVQQIHAGIPIARLRQDVIYELFRRGILDVDGDNRLYLSPKGQAAVDRINKGELATELG